MHRGLARATRAPRQWTRRKRQRTRVLMSGSLRIPITINQTKSSILLRRQLTDIECTRKVLMWTVACALCLTQSVFYLKSDASFIVGGNADPYLDPVTILCLDQVSCGAQFARSKNLMTTHGESTVLRCSSCAPGHLPNLALCAASLSFPALTLVAFAAWCLSWPFL